MRNLVSYERAALAWTVGNLLLALLGYFLLSAYMPWVLVIGIVWDGLVMIWFLRLKGPRDYETSEES